MVEQEKAKKKGCWPWAKEVVEEPLFDDVNCPYAVKPSDLFKINEVGRMLVNSWNQETKSLSVPLRVSWFRLCTYTVNDAAGM